MPLTQQLRVFALVLLVILLTSCIIVSAKKRIINDVKICSRNDPDISACYADNFRRLVPLMKNGIPEMNLLKVEPLQIEKVLLDFTESRTFRLETTLIDIEMNGLGATNLTKCKIEIVPDGMIAHLNLKVPAALLKSKYNAKGNFLLISIDSNGDFVGNFTDISIQGTWKSQKFTKKGKEFLRFTDTGLNLEVKHIRIHFENLLGNNEELNESIDKAINDNIDVLYDELKPIVLQTIRAIVLDAVNNVFGLFPFDVLFPDK